MLGLSHPIESGETPLPPWSPTLPSLVSVAKLDKSSPLWTRRESRGRTPRRGWFELGKNYTSSGIPSSHTTPVALRAAFPPQLRRGVLVQTSEFRDRN